MGLENSEARRPGPVTMALASFCMAPLASAASVLLTLFVARDAQRLRQYSAKDS